MTPSPEVALIHSFIGFEMDAALGTFEPIDLPGSYALQSRFSMIPFLHLTPGPLVFQFGYGLSAKFLRMERKLEDPMYDLSSTQRWEGEFRASAGLIFKISDNLRLMTRGGFSYIDADNYAFSASAGLLIRSPWDGIDSGGGKIESRLSIADRSDNGGAIKPGGQLEKSIRTVCIQEQRDPILSDLSSTLESAFISNGIQSLDYSKMLGTAKDHLKLNGEKVGNDQSDSQVETNEDMMHLISVAAKLHHIDAFIQIHMLYDYKVYGQEIVVNSVSIKFIEPETGRMLAILEYTSNRSPLPALKKKMIKDIGALFDNKNQGS